MYMLSATAIKSQIGVATAGLKEIQSMTIIGFVGQIYFFGLHRAQVGLMAFLHPCPVEFAAGLKFA